MNVGVDNTIKSALSGTTAAGAISAVSAGSTQVAGVQVHAASVPSAASVNGVASTGSASAGTVAPQVAGVQVHAASMPSAASVNGVASTQTASAGTLPPQVLGAQSVIGGQTVSQILGIPASQVAQMTPGEIRQALAAAGIPPSEVAGVRALGTETEEMGSNEEVGPTEQMMPTEEQMAPEEQMEEVAGVQAGVLPLTGEPFIPGTSVPAFYLVGGLAGAGALLRRLTRR